MCLNGVGQNLVLIQLHISRQVSNDVGFGGTSVGPERQTLDRTLIKRVGLSKHAVKVGAITMTALDIDRLPMLRG